MPLHQTHKHRCCESDHTMSYNVSYEPKQQYPTKTLQSGIRFEKNVSLE